MSKVWLVTGSASGLGRNIAEAVLASGDRLVATARDPRQLEDLVKKSGERVRAAPLDVTDETAAHAAAQVAVAAFGRLDVVVNNAGYGDVAPFEQLSSDRFKAVIDIDLLGSFNACRAAFEQLAATPGSIIFISAGMSYIPYPYQVHVGAAKAGIDNMMRNLALEWGKYGIRCNSIVPGPIAWTEGMRPVIRVARLGMHTGVAT